MAAGDRLEWLARVPFFFPASATKVQGSGDLRIIGNSWEFSGGGD